MPGEAVPKHVAVLSITGRDFKVETIRLKTVRPFVMKEIVLAEDKEAKKLVKKEDNRSALTRRLMEIVDSLIEQAREEWLEAQDEPDQDEEVEVSLPLVRLRVEYSAPDGGNFDCENPQRFSNRFVGKVANVNDVVQFHRKKAGSTRKAQNGVDLPEESILAQMNNDQVKVEKLVKEFLTAQSLTILPQNTFGDAVNQFVDKDDKHAMEMFVNESLTTQIKALLAIEDLDEENIHSFIDEHKAKLEELFAAGHIKRTKKARMKPRPENWDSDLDGEWADQPGALVRSDPEDNDDAADNGSVPPVTTAARGRGKAAATRKPAAPVKQAAAATRGRGKKQVVEEDSEDNNDVVMAESEEEPSLFVSQATSTRGPKKAAPAKKAAEPARRTAPRKTTTAPAKQSQLNFSQPATQTTRKAKVPEVVSDDDISDDDAFEPAPAAAGRGAVRGRR